MANANSKVFGWMADSFVLNFYQDKHWSKLPNSWRQFLPNLRADELGLFLDLKNDIHNPTVKRGLISPLSLQCLKKCVKVLSFDRQWKRNRCESNYNEESKKEFSQLFTRHVKSKKRHEIQEISKVISELCEKKQCTNVVDVGGGLGHLSRYLTYACNLKLTCIDCQKKLTQTGTKFDRELENYISKRKLISKVPTPPTYKCLKLEMNKCEQYFEKLDYSFGIIGLHTCGNLAAVTLHNFINSPAKFLISVGCCYMKLDHNRFPMSNFLKELNSLKLSYEAMEVACHAIEQYSKKLQSGSVNKLKVHSYRAALETILVKEFNIKQAGLRGVPHTETLSFSEYAVKAIENLSNVNLSLDMLQTAEIEKMLKDWYKVVLFYSLRILLANVVETAIILDRALFLKENSSNDIKILTVFDSEQSPRNFAIIAK